MLVTIAYCAKDVGQAEKLAGWMKELGPYPGHRILVARDKSTLAQPFNDIGFDEVEEMVIGNDVWGKWPESCNNVFGEIARYVEELRKEPWLWLEPDVVPMGKGWLNAIEAEYRGCQRPFLGDFVSVHTPELDVPDHMSGVGVYPWAMSALAGRALITYGTAWDVFARDQIVGKMARSKLIHHSWKHAAFADYVQVEREILAFKPGCVLFHASKDGSLIDILRNKAGWRNEDASDLKSDGAILAGSSPAPAICETPISPEYLAAVTIPSPKFTKEAIDRLTGIIMHPVCDILIKSYPPDYELLGYCLRSIDKFATGFRRVVLVVPPEHVPAEAELLKGVALQIVPRKEQEDGYLGQQAIKMSAHEMSDADYILHLDSDTVLTKPITPQTFFAHGKPLWMMTPYQETQTPWQPITEKFLCEPVEFEFMRRFPILVPRFLHVSADVFCRVRHKMSLSEYILSQPYRSFSEFNALGALAYSRSRDEFSWVDTSKVPEAGWPELVAWQTWSREELTDARRAEFEEILKGGDAKCEGQEKPLPICNAAPSFNPNGAAEFVLGPVTDDGKPLSVDVRAAETRHEAMKRLSLELKSLCTAPIYFRHARRALYLAGVVKHVGKRRYKKRAAA